MSEIVDYYVVETRNDYGHQGWAYVLPAGSSDAALARAVYLDGKRTGLDSTDITAVATPYHQFTTH